MVVFDKFPSTRVKDLLQIVNPGGDGVDGASATVALQKLPTPSHSSLSGKPPSSCSSCSTTTTALHYLAAHTIPIQTFVAQTKVEKKMMVVAHNFV